MEDFPECFGLLLCGIATVPRITALATCAEDLRELLVRVGLPHDGLRLRLRRTTLLRTTLRRTTAPPKRIASYHTYYNQGPWFTGCDPGDPAERGLFLPLDYSRQVEELWRQKIGKPCCVVAQGGLAPVGVYLASRSSDRWDGARAVAGLALRAPPPMLSVPRCRGQLKWRRLERTSRPRRRASCRGPA